MKKLILMLLCLLFSSTVFSQSSYKRVIDDKEEAIAYSNIVILSPSDSTFIYGTVSDSLGYFSIPLNVSKEIILRVSSLGYETYVDTIDLKNIKDVVLKKTSYLLDGVEITASPRIFKMGGNSVVATIENSILSKMDKLANILPYIPYVQISQGDIQVLGRGKPSIYVNNRLLSDNQELSRIEASDIKDIEVITSPGAEYDATVNAIIKVRVKRKPGEGLSGNFNCLLAQAMYTSETSSINLNFRKKKIDIFGSVGARDTRTRKEVEKNSILQDKEVFSQIYSSKGKDHWLGIDGNIGFNVALDDKKDFGAKYIIMHSPKLITTSTDHEQLYKKDNLFYSLYSNNKNKRELTTHSVNVYYSGDIGNKTNLNINTDFSTSKDNTHQDVSEIYEEGNNRTVLSDGAYNYRFYASKVVLERRLNTGKVMVGGEYSYTDYKQNYENHTPELETTMPASESHSKQNITALFGEYTLNIKKWNLIAGVRYEHTSSEFYLNKTKQENQSNYDNRLFPFLSVSTIIKRVSLSFSYNNKITRPGYYLMRGNMEYKSPFDYTMGNPALKATIKHSITSMFTYGDFQGMLTYNYQKNPIISIVEQYNQEPIILTHPININKSQSIQLAGQWSRKVRFWTPFISANITKPLLSLNLGGETFQFNHINCSFSFRNILSLNQNLYIYLNGTYNTKGHYNIYMYKPDGELQVGISKSFLSQKLSVSIWYCDVLKTNKSRSCLDISNLHIDSRMYQGSSMGMLSIVYRFNSTNNRYKGTGAASDEKSRL